jgi:integrase/recombinase XerD
MNIKPTYYLDIERRRVISSGPNKERSHLKLWVTFVVWENGKKRWRQRPYKTNIFCTQEEFDQVSDERNKRPSTLIGDIRKKIVQIKSQVERIIDTLNVTTQAEFEAYFLSEYSIEAIDGEFEAKIAELEKANKFSTAEKFRTALYSLKEFFQLGNQEPVTVTYSMCTPEKLQAYEDWYTTQPKKKGSVEKKSLTSVGINMRHFRHIYKRAIKKGVASATEYPFGMPPLYVIPEGGDDTKKFLDRDEKNAFLSWRHDNDKLNELHDYAVFSYYGNGMNMSDLARLTKDRVHNDYLTIDRQKTKGKKKKKKITVIPLHPVMKDIIQRRQKRSLIPGDYVFPILEYGSDEETIFYRIRKLVDDVNSVLALIAKDMKFEIKPTSYTLRHTFSFHFMQQEGATTEDLQDALAHGSIKTTEAYKHGFTIDRKKKFSEGL